MRSLLIIRSEETVRMTGSERPLGRSEPRSWAPTSRKDVKRAAKQRIRGDGGERAERPSLLPCRLSLRTRSL